MFPKMGKTFPNEDGGHIERLKYQAAIAAALKRELGGSHRAIKTIMNWTGVSERTAKNWIAGSHGPAGEHLVGLIERRNNSARSWLMSDQPCSRWFQIWTTC